MADKNENTQPSSDAAKTGQKGYGESPHNPAPPQTGPQSTPPKK